MTRHIKVLALLVVLLVSWFPLSLVPPATAQQTCDTTGTRNGRATPTIAGPGNYIVFEASGFRAGEAVSFWFTLPNGQVFGTPRPIEGGVSPDGTIEPLAIRFTQDFAQFPGRWALTFQGAQSNNVAVIYFCIANTAQPTPTPIPGCDISGNRNARATPNVVRPGDLIVFEASGFRAGEGISFWFTLPSGDVFGTPRPLEDAVNPDGSLEPLPLRVPQEFAEFQGRWALTFQGSQSNAVAIAFFCVTTAAQATATATTAPATATATVPAATATVPAATATAPAATATVPAATATVPIATETVPAVATPTTEVAPPPIPVEEPTLVPTPEATVGPVGMPRAGSPGSGSSVAAAIFMALLGLSLLGAGYLARRGMSRMG